jgi:hypothetical protein
MTRTVYSGRLLFSQADFFESGYRKLGIHVSDLNLHLFVNNEPLLWTLTDGFNVQNSSIGSGRVYFDEIYAGFYNVRFFPDRSGFWRVVLRHTTLNTEFITEFDAVPPAPLTSGLNPSFIP